MSLLPTRTEPVTARTDAHQTYRVDLVDPLASLVALSSDPVAVEVGTDPVQDLTRETVILPLLGVKLQHTLVHEVLAILREESIVMTVRAGAGVSVAGLAEVCGLTLSRLVK